jgi:hypothetical protein
MATENGGSLSLTGVNTIPAETLSLSSMQDADGERIVLGERSQCRWFRMWPPALLSEQIARASQFAVLTPESDPGQHSVAH